MTLYVATTNPGKLRDFAAAAAQGFEIVPLPGLDLTPPPVEDQPSFEGNARLKAVYYSRAVPDAVVLADDSGLEVEALGGAPGVYSARYADRAGFRVGASTDERNNNCLLAHLGTATERQARYRCVLAAARDGVVVATAEGSVEGMILGSPRGAGGFGYDPLFYLLALDRTMAEIEIDTRLELSHRGRALRTLLPRLGARSA